MTPGTTGLLPPLRDKQQCPPAGFCPRCCGEFYPGEVRFVWEGVAICTDCFRIAAGYWLEHFPIEAALAMQVQIVPPERGLPC